MRKKIIKMILCALLCIAGTLCPNFIIQASEQIVEVTESAQTKGIDANYSSETLVEGDWEYRILEDGTAEIKRYGDYLFGDTIAELEIPSSLGGLTVTRIDDIGVRVEKIVIPQTIVDIDVSVIGSDFKMCSEVVIEEGNPKYEALNGIMYTSDTKEMVWCARNKTSLDIPEGIEGLAQFSLYDCDKLETLSIPSSLINIKKGGGMKGGARYYCTYAFDDLPNLKSISVDADNPQYTSVDGILYSKDLTTLIYSPYAIQDLVIPETVTCVYDFEHKMNSIVYPFSMTAIENRAVSVNTIVIMNPRCTIKGMYRYLGYSIGLIRGWDDSEAQKYAEEEEISFESLGQIDFNLRIQQDGTVRITEYLGDETVITIPSEFDGKKVTCVGGETGGFSDVTKVILPEGIVEIFQDTFEKSALKEINFPRSLRVIGDDAFCGCSLTGNIIIPSHIETVGDWAFAMCQNITGFTIEEGVTDFGEGVFTSCNGIKSIQLPNSVTKIVDKMFLDCKSLESVVISDTVTSVGFGAFAGCSNLKKLFLPENIESIDNAAFSIGDYIKPWEVGNGWLTLTLHNSGCDIYDDESTMYYVNKIIGHEGSTAHQYAEKYGITFVDIDNPFADVPKSGWEYAPVEYALENGLMAGNGTDEDGKIIFKPSDSITREQFVQVIYSNSGKPGANIENKFPDVQNDWYTSAVLWANENGIANGNGDGTFGVGQNITREQLALMLYKYAQMNGYDLTAAEGQTNQYADGTMVSTYAKDALNWAITQGIISGKGKVGEDISTFRIDPQGTATRAECAAMMKKLLTNN